MKAMFKILHKSLLLLVFIISMLMLSGCLMAESFDFPYAYKKYRYHGKFPKQGSKLAEKTKADMLACGFENTSDNSHMMIQNMDGYIHAAYCMKEKGYFVPDFPNNDICQHDLFRDEKTCRQRS